MGREDGGLDAAGLVELSDDGADGKNAWQIR